MKKRSSTFKMVALVLAVIMVTIGFVSIVYDPNILHNALSWLMNTNAGNITFATGTVVTGGTVTQQAATGGDTYVETTEYLDMRDVETKVMLYKPYQTPLLTLISDNGIGSTDSWEHKYYAVDSRGMSSTITTADSYTNYVATLNVADPTMFTLYNTVYFPEIVTTTTKISSGRMLMGIVTSFPTTGKMTVRLINYGNSVGTGDFTGAAIYRGGSAMNETFASTTPWGILPDPDYNYVQIFMEQVEQSEYQTLMKKEANWNLADLKRAAIEDFKIQRERTFLAGIKSNFNLTVSNETKRFYTCGGFLNDTGIPAMTNQTLANLDSGTFTTWLKTIFTGNNGSNKRFLLGGADMIEAIEKVKIDNKWLLSKETEIEIGINWVKLVSTFGSLDVMYYEQLDLLGKEKWAIVIDKPNLKAYDLAGKGFNVRELDYRSSGVKNVDAAVIEQASTLAIKNKVTHHIIQGV